MARTRISTKGQIVLPKELRDAQGWGAGTELEVESQGNVVLLRPARLFAPTTFEEVRGCAGYTGPPRTLKEMDAGVEAGVREMWEEFERQDR